ncbi:hypothetical protein ACJX0J_008354, partial [Zea mays]
HCPVAHRTVRCAIPGCLWDVFGPYYWVKCKPDEPIPVSQPNQGSVRGRKEKKQIKQRRDFIMAEKKRRAQYSAAVKRNEAERTERKMAAVARERAWPHGQQGRRGSSDKVAKTTWRDVSYHITKINMYKDGRHVQDMLK